MFVFLFARWAAYLELSPARRTLFDDDRLLPTGDVHDLIVWWYEHPLLQCEHCGDEFDADHHGRAVHRRYCSALCRSHAGHRRFYLRHRDDLQSKPAA